MVDSEVEKAKRSAITLTLTADVVFVDGAFGALEIVCAGCGCHLNCRGQLPRCQDECF